MQSLPRMRRPMRVLAVLAGLLSLTLASGLVALANVPIVRLSTDPYTNSTSTHQTEVEPDTFAFGATIVSAFQVGRMAAAQGGGSANIGWATSTDNGATWVNGFLPGTTVFANPPGTAGRISDPSVA